MGTVTAAFVLTSVAASVVVCGSNIPPPSDKLASAEASVRAARELGAEKEARPRLQLSLATEQIEKAKSLIAKNDNRAADVILQRAHAEADLSVMLAKENNARPETSAALVRVKVRKDNAR